MKKILFILVFLTMLTTVSACANNPDKEQLNENELLPETFAENQESIDNQQDIPYQSKYLAYVVVDQNYSITNCAESSGEVYQYEVYEIENLGEATEYSRDIYWIILVIEKGEVHTVLRQDLNEYAGPIPTASDLVLEADVNFDGNNDVLLWLGHFGNQGLIRYVCYLNTDDGLIECPSFSEIANPAVDMENRVILSSWRNWAASHSYAMYYFIDDEYIEMERLTEEPVQTENGENIWTWTDEVFIDGNWIIREYFTEKDYDAEVIYRDKVYGEDCHWDIGQDRWRTLFNNGMMSDFSIYSSQDIKDSTLEVWIEAYALFLMDFPALNDDDISYFSLKDLDNNDIPELIIEQRNGSESNYSILTVYAYDNSVYKIGDYKLIGAGGLHVSDQQEFPGLFHCTWGGGVENFYYLIVNGGELVCEQVLRIDRSGESPKQTELSDNNKLIEEVINVYESSEYPNNRLEMYPINDDSISEILSSM